MAKKKLTRAQRSKIMKEAWRKKKAQEKVEPTSRIHRKERDSDDYSEQIFGLNELDPDNNFDVVIEKKYLVARGSSLLQEDPLTLDELYVVLKEMFRKDLLMKDVLILEVSNITFQTNHDIQLKGTNHEFDTLAYC